MSCIKYPGTKNEQNQKNSIKESELDHQIYTQIIRIANEIFGTGKWSHAVTNQSLDYTDYVGGKYYCGCASTVRIQLLDGTFHEDIGYGVAENLSKGSAITIARFSSVTNGLKKVLSCFGGLCQKEIDKLFSKNIKACNGTDAAVHQNGASTPKSKSQKIIEHKSEAVFQDPLSSDGLTQGSKAILEMIVMEETFNDDQKDNKNLSGVSQKHNKAEIITNNSKPGTSTEMTEEEIQRLERKRKQKEKQEEFKKKYQNQTTSTVKPNPKY